MIELNHKTFGEGNPVVILHGLFGTLDNWQTVGRQIAEQYMVYLLDQRNHGRSPHTEEITYPLMAEDLHHFLESQWMFKAHIIGHSMGGKTAMQFALQYPGMVDKLIVVDIAPKAYQGGHQAIFEALFALDPATVSDRKEAEAILSQHISERGVRQFLLKNLSRQKGNNGYQWKMNLPTIHQHYADILKAPEASTPFTGETLFIRGGQSDYIQDEDRAAILKWFPNARIETVEQAGHWVHAEAPEALLRLVLEFLEA
jgi:pimeloyl-ACP methyl ester carboxylesterase